LNRFRERIGFGPPVVIAHRGDSSHAPENTLEAARKGHASGAFAWELDVHLTRDGVPVVMHDESLLRTTDVDARFAHDPRAARGFPVSEFTWAEIRTLDAGSWFLDPNSPHRSAASFGTLRQLPEADRRFFGSGQIRVPSLLEALLLTRDLDWLVNVELKNFPSREARLLTEVLQAIDEADCAERVLISSFDHNDIVQAIRLRPEIPTGVLTETPLSQASHYVRAIVCADFLHLSAAAMGAESVRYRRDPSPQNLLQEDEAMPVPKLVYTVNDIRLDGLATHLATGGLAAMFSDDPAGLSVLLAEISENRLN
jgi:glycerophosphoryl diester phosphodiesterase